MNSSSSSTTFRHACRLICKWFPPFVNFLAIVAFVLPMVSHWHQLTPCFQRQGIVIGITLIYWQFKEVIRPSYLIESLQFVVTFILTEKLNATDQEINSACLQTTIPLTKVIYMIYFFLFGYYIGTIIVFTFLLLGAVIYDLYYHLVLVPRRRRETSIRGKEFEELEIVKYEKPEPGAPEHQLSCSICLTDFQERENVIRLPICCHHFHKKCIQIWLENHKECPYCRADIRNNLKLWKANGKRNSNIKIEMTRNAPFASAQLNEQVQEQPISLRQGNQDDGNVYVELRDT